jgi:DNA-binding transcriptional MocR family regulator
MKERALIDLSGPQPFWPSEVIRIWQECTHRAAGLESLFRTASLAGDEMLREGLARHFRLDAERITIIAGTRSAALTYGRHHRHIVIERPTFLGVVPMLTAHGGALAHASWDEMEKTGHKTDLVWLTSPYRNPDGASLSPGRRRALERMARAGRRVVVNGTYLWFDETIPPVRGADLIVSLHKLAGIGGRMAFVHSDRFLEEAVPELTSSAPPPIWQRAWALFIDRGGLELLGEVNVDPVKSAVEAFNEIIPALASAGPNVLVPVPGPLSEDDFVRELAEAGFKVLQGRYFASPSPAIRVNFSTAGRLDAARFAELLLRRTPPAGWRLPPP